MNRPAKSDPKAIVTDIRFTFKCPSTNRWVTIGEFDCAPSLRLDKHTYMNVNCTCGGLHTLRLPS